MHDGVRWDPAGVHITISGEDATARGGLATNFAVQGDFEITVSYEIVRADKPAKGYGSGVSVYAALDPKKNDAVALARRIMPHGGRTVFVSNRMVPVNNRLTHHAMTMHDGGEGILVTTRLKALEQLSVAKGFELTRSAYQANVP